MIVRRQNPSQFKNYQSYKPYLRTDFLQKCAYCEMSEHRWGGETHFGVDHFKPRKKFPKLICKYSNLYYACNQCNSIKRDTWPTLELRKRGFQFADPCQSEVYVDHLTEHDDGTLRWLTACGQYTYEHLDLDRNSLIEWRSARRQARQDLPVVDLLIAELDQTMQGLSDTERALLSPRILVLRRWRDELERDAR